MKFPIIDFHADLLSYLSFNNNFTEFDADSHSSLPQLDLGNVKLQILPLFTKTEKNCSKIGSKQISHFERLKKNNENIKFLLAIENASCLIEEDENLELFFQRMGKLKDTPVYLSLTWSQENRFGGGNDTQIGLKDEGKIVLEYLSERKICIDLSHTSDALAYDIINFIEKKNLLITPIASHSNCRSICPKERNLPDEFINYIIKKEGIIGINFVQYFVGNTPKDFLNHILHLEHLKGDNHLVLGADFFSPLILGSVINTLSPLLPIYFSEFNNSSCYPRFLEFLQGYLFLELIEKIAYLNAFQFLSKRSHYKEVLNLLDFKIS
jgi:membrane dipeptidase